MTDQLDQLALSAAYHHDMIVLLNEMRESPLNLTKTGRLQRAEIKKLGNLFKTDIYHRDENGEILFPITSEDNVRYLLFLRALTKIMYLSYHRNGKAYISKNGRGFLDNISAGIQLTHLFLTFVYELDWDYLHPGMSNGKSISQTLQDNIGSIFQHLLKNGTTSIDLKTFSQEIGEHCNLLGAEEDDDQIWWIRLSIEYTLIRELELFGIVTTTKIKKYRTSNEITHFQLTDGGKLLLARAFETTWGYRI